MIYFYVLMGLPGAAYRLTRLITKDTFPPVLWLRDRLVGGPRKPTRGEIYSDAYPNDLEPGCSRIVPGLAGVWYLDPDGNVLVHRTPAKWVPEWLAELLSCPWCASAYVSAAVTLYAGALGWFPWPDAPIVWLYTWAVAAILASKDWA